MKLLLSVLLLISNLTLLAQSNQFAGDYNRNLSEEGKHVIEYKLTLNPDGTFVFHSYSKMQGGTPPEVNTYGKGKWSAKDNIITFSSNKKEDFDAKYTLDFNNSTARFAAKNPRDKSDKIVKTRLTFLESGISWIKRLDIFKI
ncbi:copper resistance protein NlpE N-terminal domain-containing protein [Flavobacterium reichenbachii]|uniref:Uncharacterized protein n=1 Tax=Flavobacterium reichenbachii TaxID=362418 RepID=A0A085ZNV6_9FLAO|nr:copper resistance protein NlpE N-terminal domain-containing protein [Flavobacterium reichenbachii]KFF06120.1 hypothetical protein IW19_11530 [Flavobacterium reichenbachii]OXB14657.1 hypothetical protein B0A68_11420 [Flavobacterium reichenbachii]